MYKFDFDEWAKLYETDPDAFERKRKEVLEAEILKSPVENRAMLRILQSECDAMHATMDPMEATVEMSKLAARKLNELKLPLTQLRAVCEDL
jgi:hypothetical protein